MAVERVSEPAEHPLAELPLEHVDPVLEPAIDENEHKKDAAQQHEILDLAEFHTEKGFRKFFSADRFVDDGFRKIERGIEEGKGDRRQQQE